MNEATPAVLGWVVKAKAKVRLPRVEPAATSACLQDCGVDPGGTTVLDVYATLISAHSEKEQAAATFKHGRIPPDRGVV